MKQTHFGALRNWCVDWYAFFCKSYHDTSISSRHNSDYSDVWNLKRGNFRCTDQSVGVANQLQHLASIIQVLDPKLHDHLGKDWVAMNLCKFNILLFSLATVFNGVESWTQKLLVEVTTFLRSVCSWCYFGVKYHLETPYTSGRYEATIGIQYDEYMPKQITDYVFQFFSRNVE